MEWGKTCLSTSQGFGEGSLHKALSEVPDMLEVLAKCLLVDLRPAW